MIFSVGFLLQLLTIFLFLLWQFYWIITEQVANREKPKMKSTGMLGVYKRARRGVLSVIEIILILQLLGLSIFSLPSNSFLVQIIGFIFVGIGIGISISARRALGTNWVPASEYQVKEKQELITMGVYAYIRHPIYLGVCLSIAGGELVAQSYLAIVGLFLLAAGYWQARQEETILQKHFGNAYTNYMKRTKMFLPYLW